MVLVNFSRRETKQSQRFFFQTTGCVVQANSIFLIISHQQSPSISLLLIKQAYIQTEYLVAKCDINIINL